MWVTMLLVGQTDWWPDCLESNFATAWSARNCAPTTAIKEAHSQAVTALVRPTDELQALPDLFSEDTK